MPARVLTARHLNRALLARQLLLERADLPIPDALARVGGLQTQYAPSGYVGLWSRLRDFRRGDLTEALEDRTAVQATLMRTTIHLVDAREFWRLAVGIRASRRRWGLRVATGPHATEPMTRAGAERLRAALAGGPMTVAELGDLADGFLGLVGLWVDLVRVPPSGTWERRRADRLALAETWVGPEDATEAEGRRHLVTAYLGAFGPAPWGDVAKWAGVAVSELREAAEGMALERHRDERGGELLDLPGLTLPDPETPAPVRFIAHWDAITLAHARRTGVLPEAIRPAVYSSRNPFSVGTVLVDGYVAARWGVRDGAVIVEPLRELSASERDEVERERAALAEFHRD
jgi:hypothetical protein